MRRGEGEKRRTGKLLKGCDVFHIDRKKFNITTSESSFKKKTGML